MTVTIPVWLIIAILAGWVLKLIFRFIQGARLLSQFRKLVVELTGSSFGKLLKSALKR